MISSNWVEMAKSSMMSSNAKPSTLYIKQQDEVNEKPGKTLMAYGNVEKMMMVIITLLCICIMQL